MVAQEEGTEDHARQGSVTKIALGDPDHVWEALFEELSGCPDESLPEVDVELSASPSSAAGRLARIVARGYHPERAEDGTVSFVPRPAGVLWLVDDVRSARSGPGFFGGRFRRFVLVVDRGREDDHPMIDGVEELWCLPDFLDRRAVPEFVIEFLATRPVQVVQLAGSRLAADLLPTLSHSYPHLRVVADVSSDETGSVFLHYLVAHYGNLVDAFWVPDERTRDVLGAAYISNSKTVVGAGTRDAADLRASLYARLVASGVGVPPTSLEESREAP